jgi:cyclophilin family peptidyl-prolyl cis-trans isomerase
MRTSLRHLLPLLLAVVALVTAGPAATARAPQDTPADRAFEELRTDFLVIHRTIENSRGILPSDRQPLNAFLERVHAFNEQFPDHAAGVALELQLNKWLGFDEQVRVLYQRLLSIRPEDVAIAMSWLDHQESAPDANEAQIDLAYEELVSRFPDNPRLVKGWSTRLKNSARYAEALELLEANDLDPETDAELVSLLADCQFRVHRFEEALATLRSIPESALTGSQEAAALKREVDRRLPLYEEYITLWPAEQALRRAEEEADDLPRVEIITSKGRIVVELFENDAPNTVANFISLADSGFYSQTRFHRYVADFMIQGGDPNSKPDGTGVAGQGNPGYYIPDEHSADKHRVHFRDSLAMAKTQAENSGGCQFYLNFRPTPWLNGKHTVFGRVIDGHDVVAKLRQDDEILSMLVLRRRDHPYDPDTLPIG